MRHRPKHPEGALRGSEVPLGKPLSLSGGCHVFQRPWPPGVVVRRKKDGRTRVAMRRVPVRVRAAHGKAIDRGLVKAVTDHAAEEYASKEVAEPTVFVGRCPACGGDVSRWAFPEEVRTRPYRTQSAKIHATG